MVALDMDGKVRKPQFELDSEQVRYEHRFAPFNSVVTPPPVHYIQFKVPQLMPTDCRVFGGVFTFWLVIKLLPSHFLQEMSDLKKYNPPPGSADLYLAASKHFQQAKLILENVPSPDPEVRTVAVGFYKASLTWPSLSIDWCSWWLPGESYTEGGQTQHCGHEAPGRWT